MTDMTWDGLSGGGGGQKWHVIFCLGDLNSMLSFCPGWQIFVGCFVQGGKKWNEMFCRRMFCPTPSPFTHIQCSLVYIT